MPESAGLIVNQGISSKDVSIRSTGPRLQPTGPSVAPRVILGGEMMERCACHRK